MGIASWLIVIAGEPNEEALKTYHYAPAFFFQHTKAHEKQPF
jgi:hypothetical protein